jgi:hypothetical protein
MRRKAMQYPNRPRRPIHDILALAVVALCALVILAALLRPSDFESLLPVVGGAVTVVVQYYFGRHR